MFRLRKAKKKLHSISAKNIQTKKKKTKMNNNNKKTHSMSERKRRKQYKIPG